jgi:hypothetical protein
VIWVLSGVLLVVFVAPSSLLVLLVAVGLFGLRVLVSELRAWVVVSAASVVMAGEPLGVVGLVCVLV